MGVRRLTVLASQKVSPRKGSDESLESGNPENTDASEVPNRKFSAGNLTGEVFRKKEEDGPRRQGLGTYSGVLIRTCQSMWRVLIFLRFFYIVGNAGIWQTCVIVFLSFPCALLTTMSLSAIATRGPIEEGGTYYLISRALGPRLGGAVGCMYYLGVFLLEALGAVEVILFPSPDQQFPFVSRIIGALLLLFLCALVSFFWDRVIMVPKKYLQKALAEVQPDDCYPNRNCSLGKRRGLALVITMTTDRPGADAEQDKLKTLAHDLGFQVRLEENKKAEELKEVLRNIGNLPRLEADGKTFTEEERQSYVWAEDECFLCFVNAHGDTSEGAQYISDDSDPSKDDDYEGLVWILHDLLQPIAECDYLVDKPKVFVINACRGSMEYVITAGSAVAPSSTQKSTWKKEGQEVHYLAKHVPNSLLVFSTSENALSYRDRKEGSYFVCAFVKAIREICETTDVQSIITHVNKLLVETPANNKSGEKVSQCSVAVSRLLKKMYWKGSPAAVANHGLQ